MGKKCKVKKKEELCRLLKKIEGIPCVSPGKEHAKKGKFYDFQRLEAIDEEISGSDSTYKWINGKKYYRLYGQDDLKTLSKEVSSGKISKIVLVSAHADNLQKKSSYYMTSDKEYVNGCFDNASTNAVCTYLMKYEHKKLPRNILFAFTAGEENEEREFEGAEHISKKLEEYFGEGKVDVVVLDVTYGFQEGVDFTIENDFLFSGQGGEDFIKKICCVANEMAAEANYTWGFLWKKKRKEGYVDSGTIKDYMGDGCKIYADVDGETSDEEDPDEEDSFEEDSDDETSKYREKGHNTFSLCLPCSAKNATQMHSNGGFLISLQTICNYTDFLCRILQDRE